MRLWELEEGDEGREGGAGAGAGGAGADLAGEAGNNPFGGVRAAEQAAIFAAMLDQGGQQGGQQDAQAHPNEGNAAQQQQEVLVDQVAQLQLQDNAERPAGRQPHRAQLPAAQRAAQQRRANGNGGQAAPAPAPAVRARGGAGAGGRARRRDFGRAAQAQARVEPDPGLQRFLELAARDEEDGWDSDEMEEWG